MKTRVSKKAVGVFVVSLLLLLLLVVMTSNGPASLQSQSDGVCVLTPVGPTPVPLPYQGEEMPMEELVEDFGPRDTGGSWSDVPLTPIRHPQPSNQTPLVSGGGGVQVPWDVHTPPIPTYSQNPPTGPHAPYTPAQPGGPSTGACASGHEGDSVLSGNTTIDPTQSRDARLLLEAWVVVAREGQTTGIWATEGATPHKAEQRKRILDEIQRVNLVFAETGGAHRPDEFGAILRYLSTFRWHPDDKKFANRVNLKSNGDYIVMAWTDADREAYVEADVTRIVGPVDIQGIQDRTFLERAERDAAFARHQAEVRERLNRNMPPRN